MCDFSLEFVNENTKYNFFCSTVYLYAIFLLFLLSYYHFNEVVWNNIV